jgi:hypothetical protein
MKRMTLTMLALLAVCAIGAKAAEVTLIKSGTILTVTKRLSR